MSKATAILLNAVVPGAGSLMLGQVVQGALQLFLLIVGALLVMSGIGFILGLPAIALAWLWGMISSAASRR